MKISDKFKDADGAAAWDAVVKYVMVNRTITTLTGISFDATFVGNCLFLKGG